MSGFITSSPVSGILRDPGGQVISAGKAIPGLISLEVTAHNSYRADHYHAVFALFADPAFGLGYWGALQSGVSFDFQARAYSTDGFSSLMVGEVDHMSVDIVRGTISIEGRDLRARLIDAKTQETFYNQTSSQVAMQMGGRHGLTVDADDTKGAIGRYWSEDHDRLVAHQFTSARSEWDVLVYLAQREQFDVWVSATTLYFKPRPTTDSQPFQLNYTPPSPAIPVSPVIDLTFERSLTLAKDVVVAVHGYEPRKGKGYTVYDPPSSKNAAQKGTAQVFTYQVASVDQSTALQFAKSYREDITRHERLLSFHMPAETTINARGQVKFTGTGSSWDQAYWVDNIAWHLSRERGFTMDVHCKNHSPASEVQIG